MPANTCFTAFRHNHGMIAALVLPAAASAMPVLTPVHSVAEDVAEISTDVCYRLATEELRWSPSNVTEQMAQVEAAGLEYGAQGEVIESMGDAGRMLVNRAIMASRTSGDFNIVLAAGGSMPGCRVMLAGEELPETADEVGAALVAAGWTALPDATGTRGALERRLFIRFGRSNEPYITNLMVVSDPSARLRLFTSVARVPPNVKLPAGIAPPASRP